MLLKKSYVCKFIEKWELNKNKIGSHTEFKEKHDIPDLVYIFKIALYVIYFKRTDKTSKVF